MPALEPNEECEVSISLTAPSEPGHHVSYWRLASPLPRERRFGQRIWLQMSVPPSDGLRFTECECHHPGVRCHMCGEGEIRGVRWRGRLGQDDLCEAHYMQLPAESRQRYDAVLGEHPRTMAAMLKSPLRDCVKRLAARYRGDTVQLGEVLHIVEPLFVVIPKPLIEASLCVVRPFLDAMVTVDDRTLCTLQQQLRGMVHTLCRNKAQLSKTHGKPGTLLQKAVSTVAKTVGNSLSWPSHDDEVATSCEPNPEPVGDTPFTNELVELDKQLNKAARSTDDTELIKDLVRQGANLLCSNGSPWFHTPLHQAAYHNRLDVVCCLIQLLQERGMLEQNLQMPSNPCGRGQYGVPIELAMGGPDSEAVVAALESAALSSHLESTLKPSEICSTQRCSTEFDSSYNSSCNSTANPICSVDCSAGSSTDLIADATEPLSQDECTPSTVLRNNAWLLQEMGFAEDDALAALVGAEGVVEDAIDLASGFVESKTDE